MALWINHVTIAAPRNGTTAHNGVTPSSGTVVAGTTFTPTAGRLLVCVCEGSVTSTTPSGWTLPTSGSAINNTGLYVWTKTAAGSDTVSTTHNGSNYPVVFDFYEYPTGSTFVKAASATAVSSGATGPSLSSLTGTNLICAVGAEANTTAGSITWTWGSSAVEAVDTSVAASGTDGYSYSLAYLEDSVATSQTVAGSVSGGGFTLERLMFAVNVASGGTPASISVPGGVITVNATAPAVAVGVGKTLVIPAGQLAASASAPIASGAVSVTVPAGQVAASGTAPGVSVGSGKTLAIPAGVLTAQGTAPALSVGTGLTLAVPAGVVTASAAAPGVSAAVAIAVSAGGITASATAPVVTAGGGVNLAIPAGAATITGTAPVVSVGTGVALAVPAGQVTVTGHAPVVSVGVGLTLAVPAGLVTITGAAPLINIGGSANIGVPAGQLGFNATPPGTSAGASISVPAGLINLTGTPPLITVVGGVNLAIPAGLVALGATGPTVSGGVSLGVPAGSVAIAGTRPVVVIGTPVDRDLVLTFRLEPYRWTLEQQPSRYTFRTEAT